MAEIEEPVIETKSKRGRGRPKGSLNKATIAKREAEAAAAAEMREKLTLDVSFEEALGDEAPQAPQEPEEPEPEPLPEEEDPEEPEEPEEEPGPEPPPPSPKRRAKRQPKPKAPKPVRMTSPEPPSYLDILKRGLDIARHKQKAEKVAKYDSFFRY